MKSTYEKMKEYLTKKNLAIFCGILGLSLIVVLSFGVPGEIDGCGQGENLTTSESDSADLEDAQTSETEERSEASDDNEEFISKDKMFAMMGEKIHLRDH